MDSGNIVGVYKRRNPKSTSLWKLLNRYFHEFETSYDSYFQKQYGFNRPVISHVVYKYLECGDLHQGFARIRCPDYHHEYLLAFSCRGRWFCPSCHNKRWFSSVITSRRPFSILFLIRKKIGLQEMMTFRKKLAAKLGRA